MYLEFGPPGHTHNGTDAVHRIHNRVAGDETTLTLGHFKCNWPCCWRKDFTLPTAVINDAHLDFVSYYAKHIDRVAGFTNTTVDPKSVKAFKFQWSRRETRVEMLWKENADDTDRWLGATSKPETPGFFMLKTIPVGRPRVAKTKLKLMPQKYIEQMCSKVMLRQFKAHVTERQAEDSIKWLRKCAEECKIPYDLVNEAGDDVPKSDWGPAAKVGVDGLQGDFFVMQDNLNVSTPREFWKLPDDIQKMVDGEILDALAARRQQEGLPNMRYERDRPRANASVAVGANVASSKKRKSPSVAASQQRDEDDAEEKEEDSEEKEKDLDGSKAPPDVFFSQCKIGAIAVVWQHFDDTHGGHGVDLYSVKERVVAKDSGEENYFIAANKFAPVNKKIYVTDPRVLRGSWWKKPAIGADKDTKIQGWQVLCYLKKLNKSGKNFVISPVDQERILQAGKDENLVLFEPATAQREATRTFQRSDSDESMEGSSADELEDDADELEELELLPEGEEE